MTKLDTFDAVSAADITLADYLFWAGVVILLFDHVATLPAEIKTVWTRPKLPWLFMIHRYFASINAVAVAYLLYIEAEAVCPVKKYVRQSVLVIMEVIVCVVLLFRTLALYGGDRRIKWFGWASGLSLIGLTIYSLVGQGTPDGPSIELGCHISQLSRESAAFLSIPWNGLLVFDIIIFGLTLRKTIELEKKNNGSGALSSVMFRDGTMYFAAVALSNLLNILILHLAPRPFIRSSGISIASSLSVTLASRIMLNMFELGSGDRLDWDKDDVSVLIRSHAPQFDALVHVDILVVRDVEMGPDKKPEPTFHANHRPPSMLPPPLPLKSPRHTPVYVSFPKP